MKSPFSRMTFLRGLLGVIILLGVWQAFAISGMFSTALTPPLQKIGPVFFRLLIDGTLLENGAATLLRVAIGLAICFAIAAPVGIAMARSRLAERIFLPVFSVLLPIPSLAWVPLFVLWFGIGNLATILVVVYAGTFPLAFNIWSGVRAVNPLWIRAASVMGAPNSVMFRKVIWPATIPYVLTGLRLSFGRAWIGVIGGELLASPKMGLGQVIFNAREFLDTSVMLSTLIAIGLLGVVFERLVFQKLEDATVRKWGMISSV